MCLYGTLIKNPKYRANKKNKGNVPHMPDKRVGYVPIGCGLCSECRTQEGNKWRVRLDREIRERPGAKFISLTFSNEAYKELAEEVQKEALAELGEYALDNEIAKRAVQRFKERWRKHNKKYPRYWLVTELGGKGTENIHMHGLIWGELNEIEERWKPYGFIGKGRKTENGYINYVNEETIEYMVKYVTKVDETHKYYKQRVFCSNGIGSGFEKSFDARLNKYNEAETDTMYRMKDGKKLPMPIYYRNKIYTEEEREALWLHKLDKNERYVKGNKVKADNEKGYDRLIEKYREIDKQLGYGSPTDYDGQQYERDRRIINQMRRINPQTPLSNGAKPIPKEDKEEEKKNNIIIKIKRDWNEEEEKEIKW